jgi:hypothetical protein
MSIYCHIRNHSSFAPIAGSAVTHLGENKMAAHPALAQATSVVWRRRSMVILALVRFTCAA